MDESLSIRRMVENEVVFRGYNEQVQKGFDEIKELAHKTNQHSFIYNNDKALHFYCECSDENCRKRIQIKPSRYNKIHQDRNYFVLISGHEVNQIERIIKQEPRFNIVEKFGLPPETVSELQPTDVDNS